MDMREWLARYAGAVGVPPPDEAQVEGVLRLAAVAAHASQRQAAPVACWLAAAAGLDVAEAVRRAEGIGGEAV